MKARSNVDVCRLGIDAMNRGDLQAALEVIDPEVVWEPRRSGVTGTYRGHAGFREFFNDTAESFDSFRNEFTELIDLGDDRVLAIGSLHFRGKGSGIETDVPVAGIATVRDGLLVGWKDYGDETKARAVAGLEEG